MLSLGTQFEMWYLYVLTALGSLAALQLLVDVNYFLRMGLVYVRAKYFSKKVHILDSTKFTGICLTSDVDYLLSHMNNARFLRELDFARADFYQRTGLYTAIQAKGGAVVQGAATIRYRKFVRLCSMYTIVSRIIYWEGPSIYMEHRFMSPGDDFVLAIAIGKQRLLKVESEDLMREIMSGEKCPESGGQAKPELPLDLAKWIESNEISSANLRNGC